MGMGHPQLTAQPLQGPLEPSAAVKARHPQATLAWWRRWLLPSLFDVLLISIPIWFFSLTEGGLAVVLADGDTGWHIRTGQWILDHGRLIYHDLFSFTKAGEPWFAWEWLAGVWLALLHRADGLQAVALFALAAGVAFCGIVFRHMLWRGVNLWIALPLTFLCFGAATLHLLARPHMFTLVLVPAAAWWIEADRRHPRPTIWLLVPLAALWANLHGGWPALVAMLALAAIGAAAETVSGSGSWPLARRYAVLALLCLAAALVNPYGWKLHLHIMHYLRADYIRNMVGEFRAPSFRGEPMLQYELLLLASLAACGFLVARRQFTASLWILLWAHASLQSARHIPLFAGVAAPLLAGELQRAWDAWARRAGRRSAPALLGDLAADAAPQLRRMSLWPVVLLILAALRLLPMPYFSDFPPERFPVAMTARHRPLLQGARILTQDQWADYLIYRDWPRIRVFFDGRSDFYGPEIAREYLQALEGRPGWEKVLEKYRFDTVLLPPTAALASLLKISPGWRLVDDDGQAVLFTKAAGTRPVIAAQVKRICPNCAAPPNEIP